MRVVAMATIVAVLGLCAIAVAQEQNLVQDVKTEKTAYGLGDTVQFQYAVHNGALQPVVYEFSSAKQFDVWVMRGDTEIFRFSKDRMYAQVLTSLTISCGETKSFCAQWDQRDYTGNLVGPGVYTVYAQLTPTKNPPPASSGRVQIGLRGAVLVPVTVQEAITNFAGLSGKRVRISGVYRGWSPDPNDSNTRPGPPVTRSDWAISDDTGSMYMVGKVDLDPQKDAGTRITVIGKLEKTSKGQVYLILESATAEKNVCPPPKSAGRISGTNRES